MSDTPVEPQSELDEGAIHESSTLPAESVATHLTTSETTAPETTAPETTWARIDWYVCMGLVIASLFLVALHTRAYPTLSPIDELQHVDYVIRAGHFDIPLRNERVQYDAMLEAACRSVDSPEYAGPACGLSDYDPELFQERGFNTAASQFPPYYFITGIGTRALTSIGVIDSQVAAARMIGGLWAGAAWAVVWYLMGLFQVRRRHRAAIIALLMASPLVIFHASATVNADVSLMLCGAVAMLATVKYEHGRLGLPALIATMVGLFFVEATNILAIAACAIYLAARHAVDQTRSWRYRLAPLLALPALGLLRLEIAGRVQNALFPAAERDQTADRVSSAPMFVSRRVDGVDWDRVMSQIGATFTPVRWPYLSPPLRFETTIMGLQVSNWILIGLLFTGAFLLTGVTTSTAWWTRVVVAVLITAGPFYTFYFAHFSGRDFPAPARFALPLVPILAVVSASAIRTKQVFVATAIVAGFVAANSMVRLVLA